VATLEIIIASNLFKSSYFFKDFIFGILGIFIFLPKDDIFIVLGVVVLILGVLKETGFIFGNFFIETETLFLAILF
jgi:ABC-type antimicrobial peptide transport system permease subunit